MNSCSGRVKTNEQLWSPRKIEKPAPQPCVRTIDPSLIRTPSQAEWAKYLESPHWRSLRIDALQAAKRTCQRCGLPGTRVHHLNYHTLGHEALADLIVLCKTCRA